MIIISAIKIIILLGFLITIHELGHFIVAKLCNVYVKQFSIGFGPKILEKQGKETLYSLRLLPLGGFVSMEGEVEESTSQRSFSNVSIPKKMAIVAAGAIVNIIFAIVVYFSLMQMTNSLVSNQVDEVLEGFVAEELGIQEGDYIIKIGDEKISNYYEVTREFGKVGESQVYIEVDRDGEILDFIANLTKINHKSTGIYVSEDLKVILVEKNGASDGILLENDRIKKVNGVELESYLDLNTLMQQAEDTIEFEVERNGELESLEIEPTIVPAYYIGAQFKEAPKTFVNSCIYAGEETKVFLSSIIESMKMLFTGNVGVNQMTGPIGISTMVANTDGVREFAYLLAMISLSLGVTNLLPIPALDGGKLLILTIEAIRKKPIKPELEIKIQIIGFAIILGLTVIVTYNDIIRLIK